MDVALVLVYVCARVCVQTGVRCKTKTGREIKYMEAKSEESV